MLELEETLGPAKTKKFLIIGPVKPEPSALILKVNANCSPTPTVLLADATNLMSAALAKPVKNRTI